ncbi:MAG: NAD(P)-dependent oxidoreductase [Bryobacterales bacterium]|nr:NAD(P)-dependent oxidoreductase [Bryobacterales bacterium]
MAAPRVGLLHPGEMGSAAAATLLKAGNDVFWVSEGRSERTRRRAGELGLKDAGSLGNLCAECPVIVSVCPPEFADNLADAVLACGFRGLLIDANAISPERVERMAKRVTAAGARFVDAAIIGLATREPGRVWIYFSGEHASEAAALFGDAGPLQPEVIDGPAGKASALKMCYAGYNKGAAALLCATLAAAEQLGVRDLLAQQWSRSDREMAGAEKKAGRVAVKAWRFAAEMREIAATYRETGVTPGFHRAAEEVYAALAGLKDADEIDVDEILSALAKGQAEACPT